MIPGIVSAPLFASAQTLAAAAAPPAVSKVQQAHGAPSATLTTPLVTVAVSGGAGSYTHSWSTDNGVVSATAPTSATTAFQGTIDAGESLLVTCTDTVTDANGVVTTATCTASLTLVDLS